MGPIGLLGILLGSSVPFVAWGQGRFWDGRWQMHPIWWLLVALTVSMLVLILVGWVLLNLAPVILAIVGVVLGLRWLLLAKQSSQYDPALSLLRERYARGEISKEEFDCKVRDLGGPP